MAYVYREGRCRRCGERVTVDREADGHTRGGVWCGPVETEHPFAISDYPPPGTWVIPASREPDDVVVPGLDH
jgi:hypothetical protein